MTSLRIWLLLSALPNGVSALSWFRFPPGYNEHTPMSSNWKGNISLYFSRVRGPFQGAVCPPNFTPIIWALGRGTVVKWRVSYPVKTRGRSRKIDLGRQPTTFVSGNLTKKRNWELKYRAPRVPSLFSQLGFLRSSHNSASPGSLAFLASPGPWPRRGSWSPTSVSPPSLSTSLSSMS